MIKPFLCTLLLFTGSFCFGQEIRSINLLTDTGSTFQPMDGFGASDAWRTQFVGKNWPLEKRERIADLLFSQEFDSLGNPRGIGLSLWRFYLSAGSAEQGDSSEIGSNANPWRRGECFLNADGSYNWNKLEGQRWFLKAAKKRGVEKFLAFPNSPPVHYTANGKGFAPEGVIHLNLKPGYMDDYARYMARIMEHFRLEEGISFDYLSPVNEPQWDWDGHSQEGSPALNEEIYVLTKYLSRELSSRKLDTRIVIAEAGTIGHAAISMRMLGMPADGRDDQARFFFSKESPFYLGDLPLVELTISAHSYHSVWPIDEQVRNRKLVNQMIKAANPELGYWMSEYCILQENDEIIRGQGRDLGMNTALYVARIIHHDLVLTNARSWQWWTAISQVDFKDGLVYLDDGSRGETGKMGGHIESLQYDGEVRESKLLWVLGNYSRFVRPGMVRIKCELSEAQSPENGILASAYMDPENGSKVIVLVNLSREIFNVNTGVAEAVNTYTTDELRSMGFSSQAGEEIILPSRSVVTIVD
jgi:O-glycosyl hydrolase